jgi:hypothetical protein
MGDDFNHREHVKDRSTTAQNKSPQEHHKSLRKPSHTSHAQDYNHKGPHHYQYPPYLTSSTFPNHTLTNTHNTTSTMAVASKRLVTEYKNLTNDPPEGISAGPVNEDDMYLWEALIQGPEGTPFEGGIFPAELKFPRDYPLAPPTMKFTCDMWHPNGT